MSSTTQIAEQPLPGWISLLILMTENQKNDGAPENRRSLSDPNRWVELHGDYLFRFAVVRVNNRETAENLVQDTLIAAFQAKGVTVMLTTMASSDNWGQAYKQEFDSIYPELAAKHRATLIPFMMAAVWSDPKLLIGDGLHPNPAGVAKMVEIVAPPVEKLLTARRASDAGPPQTGATPPQTR